MSKKYTMRISRNTIDKLGVKLYDKASDVVGEMVSNSYDADAENVTIRIPMDTYLAEKKGGKVVSKDLEIVVEDDGHGMTSKEANDFYLVVGADRRKDPRRGKEKTKSREKRRPVMGRKGIGKLAAFGICRTIEVWSAAGKKNQSSYPITHFILKYDDITEETDQAYHPQPGKDDGKTSPKRGTRIILKNFLYKAIPDRDTFMRQLSRKFGIGSTDFKIKVIDTVTNEEEEVSSLYLDLLERTKMDLDNKPVSLDGKELPIKGWVAYSKYSYQNEEMAGVRIYARGKLAAVTRDFGHKSGFTGEYTIRTYLVGEIYADWLDEDEDLIASDRQDILWSSEKGQALKEWGKKILEKLGRKSVGPLNKRRYEVFMEKSKLDYHAKRRFGDTPVYKAALEVGKSLAGWSSMSTLNNEVYVRTLLELTLSIAPHKMIVDKLKELADTGNDNALEVMSAIFGDAKLAETASLGQIAMERIRAIETLDKAIHRTPEPPELELQKILESAPWLIEPQWTVLQANQSFENFRSEFEEWYKKQTGKEIRTKIDSSHQAKRPDFIMIHVGRKIEIVEIKKPGHHLTGEEVKRIDTYLEKMKEFREKNPTIAEAFPDVHITLVCDGVNLEGTEKRAYEGLLKDGTLERKTWIELLNDTKQTHKSFLEAKNKMLKETSEESSEERKQSS